MNAKTLFFSIALIALFTSTASSAWWNASFAYCKNIEITDTYAITNRLIWDSANQRGLNLTGLTKQADNDDVRIINSACGNGGSEIPRDIEQSGSDWATVYFLANTSVGTTTYSVYYSNATVTAPNYAGIYNITDTAVGNQTNITNAYYKWQIDNEDVIEIYRNPASWTTICSGATDRCQWIPMQSAPVDTITLTLDGNVVKIIELNETTYNMQRRYIGVAENTYLIHTAVMGTSLADRRLGEWITNDAWTANDTGRSGFNAYIGSFMNYDNITGLDYSIAGTWLILNSTTAGTYKFNEFVFMNNTAMTVGEMHYNMKAYNYTAYNSSLGAQLTNDASSPSVANVAPADEYYLLVNGSNAGTLLANFTYNASDNALSYCELWVDDGTPAMKYNDTSPVNNTNKVLTGINVTANVNLTWWVSCGDNNLNIGNSTPWFAYYNTTDSAPTVTIDTPVSPYSWQVNADSQITYPVDFSFNNTDDWEISYCELWIDNSLAGGYVLKGNDTTIETNATTWFNDVVITANVNNSWFVSCFDVAENLVDSAVGYVHINTNGASGGTTTTPEEDFGSLTDTYIKKFHYTGILGNTADMPIETSQFSWADLGIVVAFILLTCLLTAYLVNRR